MIVEEETVVATRIFEISVSHTLSRKIFLRRLREKVHVEAIFNAAQARGVWQRTSIRVSGVPSQDPSQRPIEVASLSRSQLAVHHLRRQRVSNDACLGSSSARIAAKGTSGRSRCSNTADWNVESSRSLAACSAGGGSSTNTT